MDSEAESAQGPITEPFLGNTENIYQTTDLYWLESDDIYDVKWSVKPHLNGNGNSSWSISWEPVSSHGKMQICWPSWRRFGQRVMFWLMHHPVEKSLSPSTVCVYAREIRAICEWFCFERRVVSVSEISRQDIDDFFFYLESLQLKKNSVTMKLSILRRFNQFKSLIGEGLSFDPFRANGNIAKLSREISAPQGHTPTIYPRDFFEILNSALAMLERSDYLLEKLEFYMNLRSNNASKHSKRPSRSYKKKYGESSSELQNEVRALYGSCVVVLLALWGERKHELLNSVEDNVTEFLASTDDVIEGIEHKTSGTWTGKRTKRAAIPEVRKALSIIAKLTKWTRNQDENEWFFLRLSFGHSANRNPQNEITTTTLYSLLDAFCKHADIDVKLRPHMFRRSFSMLWAWRFELGDMEMLSKLLYHNNEVFTRFYTEDEDVWEFLPEAERELAFTIIHDGLIGSRKMAGALGHLLERYRRRLIAKVGVFSPETTKRFARRLSIEGGYRSIANADGYCFINEARGQRAKCSTDGSNPNYANRSEELCVECPNFGVSESRIEYWEKRRNAHEDVRQKTSVKMLADASERGVARADRIIQQIKAKQID